MKNKTKKLFWWSSSCGRIDFQLTEEQAKKGYHPGDCDSDIKELLQEPDIKAKLAAIDPALIAQELAEYGAWNDDELHNRDDNLSRLLWIACGDIVENKINGEG